jgi:transposase-like protein
VNRCATPHRPRIPQHLPSRTGHRHQQTLRPPPALPSSSAKRSNSATPAQHEFLTGARTEEEIVGPGGLFADLTRRLVERALSAELTEHLGYERHQEPPGGTGNTRNGSTPKTLVTEHGPVAIKTPSDRKGTFEPGLVRKGQRRFEGFDDKILALDSRGLSTRDIERTWPRSTASRWAAI